MNYQYRLFISDLLLNLMNIYTEEFCNSYMLFLPF